MNLTIYRGTNEISGNCIELEHNNTRILLDYGFPLNAIDIKDCRLEDFKPNIKSKYDAVFITHAHLDHYGLLELLDKNTPIYATQDTCEIIKNIAPLISDFKTENLNINKLEQTIQIGEFKIISHNVDHSILGACALEIQCDNKIIFYTGDLRFHGRCKYKSNLLIKKLNKIDYLIMEGTTIGRKNQNKITEDNLIPKFTKEFQKNKLNLVEMSVQNVDRFISVYKACLRTKKTLVIDPYTCYVLEFYGKYNKNIPQFNWNNIRVYFARNSISTKLSKNGYLYKYKSKKISFDEIKRNKSNYVIKGNANIDNKILKEIDKTELNIIYSMWDGYLAKDTNKWQSYLDIITNIHTSGHAILNDLQKFVEDIKPSTIIPIHTEHKQEYKNLFNAPILEVEDGKTIKL